MSREKSFTRSFADKLIAVPLLVFPHAQAIQRHSSGIAGSPTTEYREEFPGDRTATVGVCLIPPKAGLHQRIADSPSTTYDQWQLVKNTNNGSGISQPSVKHAYASTDLTV
jgi:hypothetical protein